MRNLQLPGRSPVHAPTGMASSSHPLSTQTAIETLRSGGNALDAAVAACAVQCVVEPESTGIGGDCFCLFSRGGSDEIVAFNGSGRAPAGLDLDWFSSRGLTGIERMSGQSVTVPGAVDAWFQLVRDHGSMDLGRLLQPAISYARDGYPVSSRVHMDFLGSAEFLKGNEAASNILMPGGRPPEVGERRHQRELAATFEKIAEAGRDGFYTGEVAEDIVACLQANDGVHTMEDFANARGEYVTPISSDFRGHTVHQCPPNGQGVIALLLLNIMSGFEPETDGPITLERIHAEIEAARLAYRDRGNFVADPAFCDVPLDRLLSEDYAAELRAQIDPGKATHRPMDFDVPRHMSTVYITVVDKDRNACSFINTIYDNFGSGLMAPRSGVMLQNRGQGFSLDPRSPNRIEPGKRPLHTIIPGMVTKDGRVAMSYGVMGGEYQAMGHMQFLTGMFDYGLDIQEAQDRPRFMPDPFTGVVDVEGTVDAEIVEQLEARGHEIARPVKPIGGSQAIWIDWEDNILTGGSDPRKDGCAIGY